MSNLILKLNNILKNNIYFLLVLLRILIIQMEVDFEIFLSRDFFIKAKKIYIYLFCIEFCSFFSTFTDFIDYTRLHVDATRSTFYTS
jgi:hypothetical protein